MLEYLKDLRQHIHTPLVMNAYLLILNQGLSAGLGFFYWTAAARLYSADLVGKSSAIISTLGFLSVLGEFSLKSGMQRFIPRAGKQVGRLVLLTYTVIVVATLLFWIGFYIAGSWFHFADNLFSGMSQAYLAFLLIGTITYTIFIVQDGVLMGLRQTFWVLLENTIYNAAKMILLIVGVTGIFNNGIITSWFIPAPIVVILVNILIFLQFIPHFLQTEATPTEPLQIQQVVSSVTGDHIGTLLSETSFRLLPLIVINRFGASANAYFYQAWLIATMLYLVSYNISASFTVESASNLYKISQYSRQTIRHILVLIIPMTVVTLVGAPLILSIFGEAYAREGTTLLRWLALAALPYGINAWFLSYARIRADSKAIITAQGIQLVVTLGMSYWWMPRYGLSSIGLAWLLAQAIVTIYVIIRTYPILFTQHDFSIQQFQTAAATSPAGYKQPADEDFCCTPTDLENNPKPTNSNQVYIFLSPHLDDAVLSCGGYISRLARAGERVLIVTVFTGDLLEDLPISRLAGRNLRAWGLGKDQLPFWERRQEDIAAAQRLGVEPVHLGLLEAIYRRKPGGNFCYTKNTVGVLMDPEDREQTTIDIQNRLRDLTRPFTNTNRMRVFTPFGIGGHVDHDLVRDSAQAVFEMQDLVYYEDFPYAASYHPFYGAPEQPRIEHFDRLTGQESGHWIRTKISLTKEEIEARIEAASCYSSQIKGLFPSSMERNLEILSFRIPRFGNRLWQLHLLVSQEDKSRARMAERIRNYINRVGGENYWCFLGAAQEEKTSGNGEVQVGKE